MTAICLSDVAVKCFDCKDDFAAGEAFLVTVPFGHDGDLAQCHLCEKCRKTAIKKGELMSYKIQTKQSNGVWKNYPFEGMSNKRQAKRNMMRLSAERPDLHFGLRDNKKTGEIIYEIESREPAEPTKRPNVFEALGAVMDGTMTGEEASRSLTSKPKATKAKSTTQNKEAKVTKPSKPSKAKEKKEPVLNEFGYQVGLPRTVRNLQQRIRVLKKGIDEAKWEGDKLKQAKNLLNMAKYDLKVVREKNADSKKAS